MEPVDAQYGGIEMIAIAVIFVAIGYLEWVYLIREKQKASIIRIVMGCSFFLLLCAEAVYLFADNWSIGMFMNTVFSPVQKWLFAET
ncbi:MAG: hypothetical protein JWR03_388 [Cohnella sp.]|jgi:uncharacterized membrane protein|nr:hypothetical protein [Cohnella sp.]